MKGDIIISKGRQYRVSKVITARRKSDGADIKDYIKAIPIHDGQLLMRSERILGENWEHEICSNTK